MYARKIVALILLILLMLPCSCRVISSDDIDNSTIKIVATLEVFASIAKFIGGTHVDVDYILPEGADPHDYALTPEDLSKIQSADILIFANTKFFTLEQNILKNIQGKVFVDFPDYEEYNLTILSIPGFGINYHGYWILPDNALAIARAIYEKLVLLDPYHISDYDENLRDFKERINYLKSFLTKTSVDSGLYHKNSVVAVPGAAYVAYSFEINVIATLLKGPGRFANTTEIQRIREMANKGELHIILCPVALKNSKADEMAKQLSSDINVPLIYVRVFSMTGLRDYFALMTYNAAAISGASQAYSKSTSSELIPFLYLGITILFLISVVEGLIIFVYKRRAEVMWSE